jgi:putative nucleotidyltransferase with HDIG domain
VVASSDNRIVSEVHPAVDLAPPFPGNAGDGLTASSILGRPWAQQIARHVRRANSELWLLLALFVLAGLMNVSVLSHRAVLNLFTLPTVLSAFLYGRRHSTLTALGSLLLVVLLFEANPALLPQAVPDTPPIDVWLELTAWGAGLMLTSYLMGTLYEHRHAQLTELRETYHGVLMILRHFVANDTYTENHCYRVSLYSVKIASELGLSSGETEDVRAAALLHDIGKIKVSRDLLHKAAKLSEAEFAEMKRHVEHSVSLLEPAGGALRRILPIVLAHHEKYDGSGYSDASGELIPIGARIIAVADAYDAMVSDRPYRKAIAPFEAKDTIERGAGSHFDPHVVNAFLELFRQGEMDVSPLVV